MFLQAIKDSQSYMEISEYTDLEKELLGKQLVVLEDLLHDLHNTVYVAIL